MVQIDLNVLYIQYQCIPVAMDTAPSFLLLSNQPGQEHIPTEEKSVLVVERAI